MGFGSFLKGASSFLGATSSASGLLGMNRDDRSNTLMSSMPFIGEAHSAKQAQQFSAEQAQKQMDYQSSSDQKQMDFQERMANTAHQRQAADLKQAGLNPILSANSGAPAPTGTSSAGAMAKGEKHQGGKAATDMLKSIIKNEVSIGQETAKKLSHESSLSSSRNDLTKSQNLNTKKNTEVLAHTAKKVKNEAAIAENNKAMSDVNRALYGLAAPVVKKGSENIKDHFENLPSRLKKKHDQQYGKKKKKKTYKQFNKDYN